MSGVQDSEWAHEHPQYPDPPEGGCPTCEGTGTVSNCSPLTCNGSHVNCVNDDCPDCMDPALPDEPPLMPWEQGVDPDSAVMCGLCGMRQARAGLTACSGCAG